MGHLIIPYEEFKGDCRHLAAILIPKNPSSLFGMMRGGMIVALYVAHELGLSADSIFPIYPARIGNPYVTSPILYPREGDILIEDVLDSGKTQEDLYSIYPWLQVAVLYSKIRSLTAIKSMHKPIVGRYILTKDYIVLPHEVVPTVIEGT